MGWTYFHRPKGQKAIATIKREFGDEWCASRVVAESATRDAVFLVIKTHEPDSDVYVPDADGFVRAIAVIKINNRPKDHYNFGYKDMSETCGPYGCECPPSIIEAASPLRDLIGPLKEYSSLGSAREYRARSLKMSKLKALKRNLKPGQKITLAKPLKFGGTPVSEFTVAKGRVRGRKGISTYFYGATGACHINAADLDGATVTSSRGDA